MSVPAATATRAQSAVEQQIGGIRVQLEHQQYEPALAAAQALLASVPENRDVLYSIAVAQRYLGQVPAALATLERLEQLHPRYSRLYQERGYCFVAQREAALAIDSFLHAVNLNPALPGSWRTLQRLFMMTGRTAEAETAAAHVATLARLPPDVVTATSMFSDGDLIPAEHLVRAYLVKHGDHVEAMRLLARIGLELDVLDDAETLLEAVLAQAPGYTAARFDYVRALLQRHKHAQALQELDKLLQLEPNNRHYRTTYATASLGIGNFDKAIDIYRELMPGAPQPAELHLSIAHALKTLGRQPEAIESYQQAIAARPNFGDAYWSLANLKTYRFSDEQIARMRTEEAAATTPTVDRLHLCFALGKALEDAGHYDESFDYYQRGNRLKRAECRYDAEAIYRNAALQRRVCTREFFAARQGWGCDSAAPIFIVGLPRSGSTLIEQILASHSQIEGTAELADIPRIVLELQGRETQGAEPRYPQILTHLKPEDFRKLGERYLSDTQVYRTGKAHFIDKMPNNFRHIGLIHLMLPHAKIIDARREPMACCFSNFKQLFASGQEFTYSLEEIGRYYRSYIELMAHWDAVLPGRVLRVEHELLVQDLETQVRRLLAYLDLPFEPACLQFHKTERSVRTASSEQVRRPIFKEGLDQWRHFEPWLDPLRAALGTA